MKPPPRVSEEKEEVSPGVEEEDRCSGVPTSPSSHLMKPPPGTREERCGSGKSVPSPAYAR
jgi:hypothetical protein